MVLVLTFLLAAVSAKTVKVGEPLETFAAQAKAQDDKYEPTFYAPPNNDNGMDNGMGGGNMDYDNGGGGGESLHLRRRGSVGKFILIKGEIQDDGDKLIDRLLPPPPSAPPSESASNSLPPPPPVFLPPMPSVSSIMVGPARLLQPPMEMMGGPSSFGGPPPFRPTFFVDDSHLAQVDYVEPQSYKGVSKGEGEEEEKPSMGMGPSTAGRKQKDKGRFGFKTTQMRPFELTADEPMPFAEPGGCHCPGLMFNPMMMGRNYWPSREKRCVKRCAFHHMMRSQSNN